MSVDGQELIMGVVCGRIAKVSSSVSLILLLTILKIVSSPHCFVKDLTIFNRLLHLTINLI